MQRRTKRFYWLILIAFFGFTGCSTKTAEKQILSAIEIDSSISNRDLQLLIDPGKTLKLEECKGKPLTIAVLTLAPSNPSNTSTPSLQFFPASNPAKVFQEIQRNASPLTLFHADRITDLDCDVDHGEAKGSFSILVPDLFQWKIGYVAKRYYGRWIIDEFLLPSFDIRYVRQSDGTWKTISIANKTSN